jgi:hypothetical protein
MDHVGSSVVPSPTQDGSVRTGAVGSIGFNNGGLVAAVLDNLCEVL